jgi:hypothetical protein
VGVVVIVVVALIGTALGRLTTLRSALDNSFARVTEELRRHHEAVRESLERLPEQERGPVADALALAEKILEASENAAGDAEALAALRECEASLDTTLETASGPSEELHESRDRRAFAVEAYDEAARAYEVGRRKPPGATVAGFLGYLPALALGWDDAERSG